MHGAVGMLDRWTVLFLFIDFPLAICSMSSGVNAASDSQVQTVDMYRAMQKPKDGKDMKGIDI